MLSEDVMRFSVIYRTAFGPLHLNGFRLFVTSGVVRPPGIYFPTSTSLTVKLPRDLHKAVTKKAIIAYERRRMDGATQSSAGHSSDLPDNLSGK